MASLSLRWMSFRAFGRCLSFSRAATHVLTTLSDRHLVPTKPRPSEIEKNAYSKDSLSQLWTTLYNLFVAYFLPGYVLLSLTANRLAFLSNTHGGSRTH